MRETLLCVDVGGTKCDLAIVAVSGDYIPLARKRYAGADFSSLEELFYPFLELKQLILH